MSLLHRIEQLKKMQKDGSPAFSAVLECQAPDILGALDFRQGDARRLARFDGEGVYGDPVIEPEDVEMFSRLLAMARKMEEVVP